MSKPVVYFKVVETVGTIFEIACSELSEGDDT